MTGTGSARNTRAILWYFGPLTLLIYLVVPESLLDIPTTYMLKDQLHATATEVSLFRLLIGIPIYLGFIFGMIRDLWNPFNLRDRGLLLLFAPLTAAIYIVIAFGHVGYTELLIGMTAAFLSSRLIVAAYQGLIALIGQEALMSGRLSTLWNTFFFVPLVAATIAGGFIAEHMTPRETFLMAAGLTLLVAAFGFWKPGAVFSHTYDNPLARGSNLFGDIKRLFKHRAIYPAVLINFLWYFQPGINTPMQFHLTNVLHASDAIYADFLGIYWANYVPTFLLYGFLCTRMPLRKLLWWSTLIGIPQMIPLAFIHSGNEALLIAIPMGLMSGLANAAFYDLAMRSCPAGLQGTFMMLIAAVYALALRGGDVLGTWIYSNSTNGFVNCVIASVVLFALIVPLIPWIPKEVTATADGESGPALEAALLSEGAA
jgi:hypothetical protein